MFEEPYGEDGESEQHDEDEQVSAVLPVALLSLLLGNDILHAAVVGPARSAQADQQAAQDGQRQSLAAAVGRTVSSPGLHI